MAGFGLEPTRALDQRALRREVVIRKQRFLKIRCPRANRTSDRRADRLEGTDKAFTRCSSPL
jgi:hypothetical protein